MPQSTDDFEECSTPLSADHCHWLKFVSPFSSAIGTGNLKLNHREKLMLSASVEYIRIPLMKTIRGHDPRAFRVCIGRFYISHDADVVMLLGTSSLDTRPRLLTQDRKSVV